MPDERLIRANAGVNVEGEIFVSFGTPTARITVFLSVDEAEVLARELGDAIERARRRTPTGGDAR